MKKAATIFTAASIAAFGLAACGSDDDSDSTSSATGASTEAAASGATLAVAAPEDGSFAYEPNKLDAAAGETTVEFENPATLSHDLDLEDAEGNEVGKTDLISQDKASFSADLKPGSYTFYCTVPGHREGGMEGTITVK